MIALLLIFLGIFATGLLGGSLYWAITSYQRSAQALAEKMPDQTVVELAMENGGEITLPLLIQHGLTASEAQSRIWQMQTNGLIQQSYDWTTWQSKYVLQGKVRKNYSQSSVGKRASTSQIPGSARQLTDAEVIQLAIRSGGKLTPAALCVKAEVPVDEAKAKLEELYRKEIFTMDVSQTGTLTYVLLDQDLLG